MKLSEELENSAHWMINARCTSDALKMADRARKQEKRIEELEAHCKELIRAKTDWDRFISSQDALKEMQSKIEELQAQYESMERVADSWQVKNAVLLSRIEDAKGLVHASRMGGILTAKDFLDALEGVDGK